jgi:signal transduction histidine kinase
LERQLRKFAPGPLLGELEPLLDAIDAAYRQADADRALLERSLELTSQELLQRTHRLRAFFENAPFRMGIVEIEDDDLVIVSQNAAVVGSFAPPGSEPISMRALDMDPSVVEQWRIACRESLRTGEAVQFEHAEQAGPQRRWLNVTVGPVHSWLGLDACCYVAEDATQRQQLLDRVSRQERLASLGILAAGVAHEINNPLGYISASVEFASAELDTLLVASDPEGPVMRNGGCDVSIAAAREALVDAREGIDRVTRIVRDMGMLSRDDPSRRAAVNINRVIESACTVVAPQARPRARLVLELQPTPRVVGDEARLGQVLLNLLVNAVHAIEPGAASENFVRIRSGVDDGGDPFVEVSDSGSGIEPDLADRIFDPFFTTKPVGGGTGLGLAISASIVRAYGGDLSVTQTAVGRGTTFRVALRAAQEPPRSVSSSPPRRSSLLVVDDDEGMLRAITRLLGRDHNVTAASSALDVIDQLEAGGFDGVLCDVRMPDLDGIELYRRVTDRWPGMALRFVLMTGGGVEDSLAGLSERYPNALVLTKPLDVGTLRAMVERWQPLLGKRAPGSPPERVTAACVGRCLAPSVCAELARRVELGDHDGALEILRAGNAPTHVMSALESAVRAFEYEWLLDVLQRGKSGHP